MGATKSERESWGRLIVGSGLVAAAAYAFQSNSFFPAGEPVRHWLMGVTGLIGFGLAVTNALELYGRRVRKLDAKGAAAFAGGAWGNGIVGVIQGGGVIACLYFAYNYLTGPFEVLPHATKLLAILLGAIAIAVFWILIEVERIRKKLP